MPILFKLTIALLLGAAIGLEREAYEKKMDKTRRTGVGSLGIRTYSLISLLGTIAGLSYVKYHLLFLVICGIFAALLIIYYILGSQTTKDIGITTEMAILLTFIFGTILGIGFLPVQMIIALSVVLILILSLKEEIKSFVAGVKEYELDAFISYAIIALVVLPFLPDISYRLADIPGLKMILGNGVGTLGKIEVLNPFNLWKVVVLITGIEVLGYLLERTVGQKGGWLLTSIAGGFISSTSTTQSLAIRSKKTKTTNKLISAALIANVSSFLQHFILIASLNAFLLVKSVGYIAGLVLSGTIITAYFFLKKDKKLDTQLNVTKMEMKTDSIFSLKPALQFALLFLLIKFVSKAALVLFGNNAFFITVAFSALAGMDAITINISELAGKLISWEMAVVALMLANAINLLAKSAYAFMLGSRSFSSRFLIGMLGIVVGGVAGLLLTL